MVNYLELPVGDRAPEVFRAVIEIPLDGTQKFEYDKELHVFKLDRNLHSRVHYPGDYGFIPSTLSDDGDPLDVLVLVPSPSFPGCVQEVRPIGLLEMLDQNPSRQVQAASDLRTVLLKVDTMAADNRKKCAHPSQAVSQW